MGRPVCWRRVIEHGCQLAESCVTGALIMKQRLVRRIGNGTTTKIWNTNWIAWSELMRPLVSRVVDPPQMVSDFIDKPNARWNTTIIHEVFLRFDAKEILQIPICLRNVDDYWSWMFEESWNFSVRSTYRMIVDTKHHHEDWLEERAGPSNSKEEEKVWVKMWKVSVPAKLPVFLWRLAHQSMLRKTWECIEICLRHVLFLYVGCLIHGTIVYWIAWWSDGVDFSRPGGARSVGGQHWPKSYELVICYDREDASWQVYKSGGHTLGNMVCAKAVDSWRSRSKSSIYSSFHYSFHLEARIHEAVNRMALAQLLLCVGII
jgi:hypothetical protein